MQLFSTQAGVLREGWWSSLRRLSSFCPTWFCLVEHARVIEVDRHIDAEDYLHSF